MAKDYSRFMLGDIKINYVDPIVCPQCGEKYVPTKKSPNICILCKNGKKHLTNFDWDKAQKSIDI